jgi:hypothetical protein
MGFNIGANGEKYDIGMYCALGANEVSIEELDIIGKCLELVAKEIGESHWVLSG